MTRIVDRIAILTVLLGFCGLLVAIPASAELVAHWPMDEGQGDTTADVVGQGGDGTLNGDPVWVETNYGLGLEFDAGKHVEVLSKAALEPPSITVTAWVLFHDLGMRQDFISKNDAYALSFQPASGLNAVIMAGNDWIDLPGATGIQADRWYHTALTFDEGSQRLKLYIDGDLDAEQKAETGIEYDRANQGSLTLGTYTDRNLRGILDEVRIYNEELSADQIAEDMVASAAVSRMGKLPTVWAGLKDAHW